MGARLQGDFYSQKENDKYTITIDDSTYSSTIFDFNLVFLRWNYQGITKDRYNPILSSICEMGIVVANSNIESCLNDLIGAAEERFRVKIEKNDALYWAGHIILDLAAFEDAPVDADAPPTFSITATDGLGRLNDIEYNNAGTEYTGKETFKDHIFNVLGKLNLDDFWGTTDDYFYSICYWFETNQTAAAADDALVNARFDHKALIKIDDTGSKIFTSSYEVLKRICETWGARFMLSNGKYRLTQINEHENATYSVINRYQKDGTAKADLTTVNHTKTLDTDIIKYKGGQRLYYPGLKEVCVNYKHFSTQNFIPGSGFSRTFASGDLATTTTPTISVSDIDDNSNTAKILVTFGLSYSANYTSGGPNLIYKFKLRVKVGSYYLKRTASIASNGAIILGNQSWETTASDYEFFSAAMIANDYTYVMQANVISPDLEGSGDMEVKLSMSDILNPDGSTNTDNFTVFFSMTNPYLEVLEEGTIEDRSNVTKFKTSNDNANNSAIHRVETLFGDGPGPNSFGHIEAYYSSNWHVSDGWKRLGASTYIKFSQLLANEILAGQYKPVEKNTGTFEGDYEAYEVISKGSVRFILGGGTFDAQKDTWNGEWFEVGADDTQVTAESSEDFLNDPETGEGYDVGPSTPPTDSEINGEHDDAPLTGAQPPLTTDSDISSGGAITSIPTDDTTEPDVYLDGDTVIIEDPLTGNTDSFTVDGDVDEGDGSITVDSQTPNNDYPSGSNVYPDPEEQQSNISHGRHKFFQYNLVGYSTDITTTTFEVFFRVKDTGVGLDSPLAGERIKECWFEIGQAVSGSPLVGYTVELFRGASTTVVSQTFTGQSTIVRNTPSSGEDVLKNDVYRFKVTRTDASGLSNSKGLNVTLVIVW